jgi:DNA-binding NtrC family response regulator
MAGTSDSHYGRIVGCSDSMRAVLVRAKAAAACSEPLLISGESGVGKELLARTIHERGPRRARPLVVVDGHGLGSETAVSELFGMPSRDGGACDAGAFERARGGTLLLDEVAVLPLEVQDLLITVLDDASLSSDGPFGRDVRVIATTSDCLESCVAAGVFRGRLFTLLSTHELTMPPLRERRADIRPLGLAMLEEIGCRDESHVAALDRALTSRAAYRWPGNGRELWAFVRRVAWLGDGSETPAVAAPPGRLRIEWNGARARGFSVRKDPVARLLAEVRARTARRTERVGGERGGSERGGSERGAVLQPAWDRELESEE